MHDPNGMPKREIIDRKIKEFISVGKDPMKGIAANYDYENNRWK